MTSLVLSAAESWEAEPGFYLTQQHHLQETRGHCKDGQDLPLLEL